MLESSLTGKKPRVPIKLPIYPIDEATIGNKRVKMAKNEITEVKNKQDKVYDNLHLRGSEYSIKDDILQNNFENVNIEISAEKTESESQMKLTESQEVSWEFGKGFDDEFIEVTDEKELTPLRQKSEFIPTIIPALKLKNIH